MFMSIEEIYEKFDGEWIYAIDCEENDVGTILGGKVVSHSRNHDDVMRVMAKYESKDSPIGNVLTHFRYVGELPEGTALLL